jgi:hypothetical protein
VDTAITNDNSLDFFMSENSSDTTTSRLFNTYAIAAFIKKRKVKTAYIRMLGCSSARDNRNAHFVFIIFRIHLRKLFTKNMTVDCFIRRSLDTDSTGIAINKNNKIFFRFTLQL